MKTIQEKDEDIRVLEEVKRVYEENKVKQEIAAKQYLQSQIR